MTVSVITSSIGRKELRQCIESVAAQTYPCRHYVYVNGPKWHKAAVSALPYNHRANVIFLPEETGDHGHGPNCNGVFSAGPHLTQADWIFYLNDDDFFDVNHVESIMTLVKKHDLKWAYSLRKFVNVDGSLICEDNWNSLGHFPCLGQLESALVDNSCFAVHRSLAMRLAMAWHALPVISDRCFLQALKDTGAKYGSTGLYTTNYRIGTGTADPDYKNYLANDLKVRASFPNGFPWAGEKVFA